VGQDQDPRINLDQVVVEGTGRDDLRKGPGHISSTVMPGEPGTFAVSGHRVTYGGPFFNLDKLEPGDQIVIETRHALYTYRMTKRRIVAPTEVSVLDDVRGPDGSLEATIVLTTCNPRGSARQRMIIFGKLASTRPAARSPT
jgi:sortase A